MENSFSCASIFSGGGFGSKGMQRAGGKELFAVDIHPWAKKVFTLNFPSVPFFDINALDVKKKRLIDLGVKAKDLKHLDILLLSSPCTGISRRNRKRHPYAPVNMLLLHSVDIIKELQPKIAIIENVEGLLDKEMLPLLVMLLAKCQALENYNFEYRVLNSKDYGVPQNRKRFILILTRTDIGIPVWPEKSTVDYKALNLRKIYPHIVAFDAGGSRKKIYAPGTNKVIGRANKWVHAHKPIGTLTAKGHEVFMDLRLGVRRVKAEEKIVFIGAEDMHFDGCTEAQVGFVGGNGIMPNMMEAIVAKLRDEYLK